MDGYLSRNGTFVIIYTQLYLQNVIISILYMYHCIISHFWNFSKISPIEKPRVTFVGCGTIHATAETRHHRWWSIRFLCCLSFALANWRNNSTYLWQIMGTSRPCTLWSSPRSSRGQGESWLLMQSCSSSENPPNFRIAHTNSMKWSGTNISDSLETLMWLFRRRDVSHPSWSNHLNPHLR